MAVNDAALFHRLVPRDGAAIPFTIDGEPVEARAASPNSKRRSAGFCLMAACQDCWVALADGRRVRACTTLVEPDMAVLIDGAARA